MLQSLILALALCITSPVDALSGTLPDLTHQQPLKPASANSNITVRDATEADLDDITTVFIDAFGPSPKWRYVFAHRHGHEKYHRYCLRQSLNQYLNETQADPGRNLRVIDVSCIDDKSSIWACDANRTRRVVSFSAWELLEGRTAAAAPESASITNHNMIWPYSDSGGKPLHANDAAVNAARAEHTPSFNCSAGLDTDPAHNATLLETLIPAHQKYIVERFGRQVYIGILATHPDYDGHGFAAMHLRQAFERADALGWPVTLESTPAGYALYRSLGFEDVHNITIPTGADWKGEGIWLEVMVRYPQP